MVGGLREQDADAAGNWKQSFSHQIKPLLPSKAHSLASPVLAEVRGGTGANLGLPLNCIYFSGDP